jgi:hypothetical protein
VKIKRTCEACPSQVEIERDDGEFVYARYRHGLFAFGVGATIDEAWHESFQSPALRITDEDDGFMTTSLMLGLLEHFDVIDL